jgi:large subunit ribosomal protein L25
MLHADLFAVDADQTIEVSVPIHIVGTAIGVSLGGGILDFPLREIEVVCLPRAIPEEIPVDVSALQLGDSIHVRDLTLPQGVELLSDSDLSVVSVVAPAKAEEEVAPVEADAAPAAAEGGEPAAEAKTED